LGALIVFATFIVRDVKRDHVRDVADSIRAAQGIFSVRREIESVQEQLTAATDDIGKIEADPRLKQHPDLNIISRIPRAAASAQSVAESIDNMDVLLEELPEAEETKGKIPQLLQEAAWAFQPMLGVITLIEAAKGTTPGAEEWVTTMKTMLSSLSEAEKRLSQVSKDISSFSPVLLEAETTALRNAKRSYDFYNRLTYVLYPLGWVLALFGRLHEAEVPTEAG